MSDLFSFATSLAPGQIIAPEDNTNYGREIWENAPGEGRTAWFRLDLAGKVSGLYAFDLSQQGDYPNDTICTLYRDVNGTPTGLVQVERWYGPEFHLIELDATTTYYLQLDTGEVSGHFYAPGFRETYLDPVWSSQIYQEAAYLRTAGLVYVDDQSGLRPSPPVSWQMMFTTFTAPEKNDPELAFTASSGATGENDLNPFTHKLLPSNTSTPLVAQFDPRASQPGSDYFIAGGQAAAIQISVVIATGTSLLGGGGYLNSALDGYVTLPTNAVGTVWETEQAFTYILLGVKASALESSSNTMRGNAKLYATDYAQSAWNTDPHWPWSQRLNDAVTLPSEVQNYGSPSSELMLDVGAVDYAQPGVHNFLPMAMPPWLVDNRPDRATLDLTIRAMDWNMRYEQIRVRWRTPRHRFLTVDPYDYVLSPAIVPSLTANLDRTGQHFIRL